MNLQRRIAGLEARIATMPPQAEPAGAIDYGERVRTLRAVREAEAAHHARMGLDLPPLPDLPAELSNEEAFLVAVLADAEYCRQLGESYIVVRSVALDG